MHDAVVLHTLKCAKDGRVACCMASSLTWCVQPCIGTATIGVAQFQMLMATGNRSVPATDACQYVLSAADMQQQQNEYCTPNTVC